MQPLTSNDTKAFQVSAPSEPDLKPNSDIERVTEINPPVCGSQMSLSERRVVCKKQLQFLDYPELYIQRKDSDRNPIVFPFFLDGSKHFKIDQNAPILNHDCSLEILGDNPEHLHAWSEAMKRVSNIFLHGFKNVCKVTLYKKPYESSEVLCHHFVNYLAFGMDKQEDIEFSGWYENLPYSSNLPFNEKDLKWGDIVQLSEKGKLKHSMFYIGNGKYINKHGGTDIFFQDLKSIQKIYTSDSVRIIRVSPDYYSSENVFKRSYD